MTIQKRWIQSGVLCGLVLGRGSGFHDGRKSTHRRDCQKLDHAALAAWYDEEAARLRRHPEGMAMAEACSKNQDPGVVSRKINMIGHCETLAGMYTKAAEEADQMAKTHQATV